MRLHVVCAAIWYLRDLHAQSAPRRFNVCRSRRGCTCSAWSREPDDVPAGGRGADGAELRGADASRRDSGSWDSGFGLRFDSDRDCLKDWISMRASCERASANERRRTLAHDGAQTVRDPSNCKSHQSRIPTEIPNPNTRSRRNVLYTCSISRRAAISRRLRSSNPFMRLAQQFSPRYERRDGTGVHRCQRSRARCSGRDGSSARTRREAAARGVRLHVAVAARGWPPCARARPARTHSSSRAGKRKH